MDTITANPKLVAFCGLYCGACKKYLNKKCPGCAGNEKASWCKVRSCNMDHNYKSCAECTEFKNVMDCGKYNNFIARVVGFVLRSDRAACVKRIKEIGLEAFAGEIAATGKMSIKK